MSAIWAAMARAGPLAAWNALLRCSTISRNALLSWASCSSSVVPLAESLRISACSAAIAASLSRRLAWRFLTCSATWEVPASRSMAWLKVLALSTAATQEAVVVLS